MSTNRSWWRRFLGFAPDGYRKAVEVLRKRYIEERQRARQFTDQAGKMQYLQFREKLLSIAAEESQHADSIAEKINLLGGNLPEVPPISVGEQNSWRYLLDDLEDERRSSEELFDQIRAIDPELPQVAELLQRIYEDETKHRSELREMLMRSDPQALWPA
jgi:bacterioferritin (cytochrome b1)